MYRAETLESLEVTDSDVKNFSHIAETSKILKGYVAGTPVEALCGKIFLPTRNPDGLEICKTCKEIADSLYIQYSL
jgi:hypothetical protein